MPHVPSTLAEAAEFIVNSRYGRCGNELTFREHITTNAGEALIFATRKMLGAMDTENGYWHCDATFKVCPRLVYQLLTIGFIEMDLIKNYAILCHLGHVVIQKLF